MALLLKESRLKKIRERERDERSPRPRLSQRMQALNDIYRYERDPQRKQERFDALMVNQDEHAVANLSMKPEIAYFRDVKTLYEPPFRIEEDVEPYGGEGDI